MIIKLTLETEHPERVVRFLEKHAYLHLYPFSDPSTDEEWPAFLENYKKYHNLMCKDKDDDELHPSEKEWIRQQILQGWNEFTSDPYEQEYFQVEIVDSCTGQWENAKAFYVFTGSYTKRPYLQF